MKRKGSILIASLLVFVVVFMGALYILHASTQHMNIAKNNGVSNQAFYSAEKKIYMTLFEDQYYKSQLLPSVNNYLRGNEPIKDVILNKEDLDNGDSISRVKASLEVRNNRQCINVIGESKVNNQSIKVSSVYSIVNDLYELGLPIIHYDFIDEEQKQELNSLMLEIAKGININNLPRHITGISSFDY